MRSLTKAQHALLNDLRTMGPAYLPRRKGMWRTAQSLEYLELVYYSLESGRWFARKAVSHAS